MNSFYGKFVVACYGNVYPWKINKQQHSLFLGYHGGSYFQKYFSPKSAIRANNSGNIKQLNDQSGNNRNLLSR